MTDYKASANHDASSPMPSLHPNQHEEDFQPRRERKAWRGTVSLAIAETTSWGILYYSFGVLLAPFETTFGASRVAVSGAFSLALLTSGLAARPVGHSLERWGVRQVMTLGALLGIVSYGLLAIVTNLTALYLVWAFIGVSHAAILYEPAFAAITQWFPNPRQRSSALLLLTSFAGFASTIFVPITAALCTDFGWRTTVLVLTGMLLVIVLPLHATLPSLPLSIFAPLEKASQPSPSQQRMLLSVLAIVLTLNSIATTGIGVHLVPYLQTSGFSLQEAASVMAFVGAAQVPGRLLFRPLELLLASQWRFAFVLLTQALGLLGLLYPNHHTILICTVILWGASNGMVTLVRATIIAEWFGREHYASIGGYVSSWSLIGRAAAPLIVSLVYYQAQSYIPALLMLAGLLIVSCMLILYAERLRRT